MTETRLPTHIMGVSLLHKCNLNCDHCGYIYIGDAEDHIIRPGYRLTWGQVMTVIRDCLSLENSYWNVNYTGGEPTLWEEDGRDLADILIATAKSGALPTYNTNGVYFENRGRCRDFFFRYVENSNTPLKTFVSMDKFHKNYDQQKGRAKSLDTMLEVFQSFPEEQRKILSIHVVIIVTKDPDSSLPAEMKTHYGSWGVTFGDFPMLNIGKSRNMQDQLPDFPSFTPPPRKEEDGPPGAVLVGDDYYLGNKKIGKLGHILELYPRARK